MYIRTTPCYRAAPLIIAAALFTIGCDDDPTGPGGEAGGPTGSLVDLSDDEVLTSAFLSASGTPTSIVATFAVRNGADEPAEVTLAGACPAGLRLYSGSDRSGTPVWDSARLARCIGTSVLERVIVPGDSVQVHFLTDEAEILGDSLSAGRYLAAVTLTGADGSVIELPGGEVVLTGATLVEVTIDLGDEVTVPGTDLRIGLVEVADDQRCAARDAQGNRIDCFWQGNADIVLSLSAPGAADMTMVLRSGFEPQIEYAGFLIRFVGLSPERIEGETIDQDDYVVTLGVAVP